MMDTDCLGAVVLSNIQRLSTLLVYIWSLGCVLGTVTQGRNPGAACAAGFQCWKLRRSLCHLCQGTQGGNCFAAAETETTSGYSWVSLQSPSPGETGENSHLALFNDLEIC